MVGSLGNVKQHPLRNLYSKSESIAISTRDYFASGDRCSVVKMLRRFVTFLASLYGLTAFAIIWPIDTDYRGAFDVQLMSSPGIRLFLTRAQNISSRSSLNLVSGRSNCEAWHS